MLNGLSRKLFHIRLKAEVKKFLLVDMLGVLSGVVGGIGAIVFIEMIEVNKYIFFEILADFIEIELFDIDLTPIFLPALGGLIIGPMVYKYAPETKGHGVPEVIEAIKLHKGYIRRRVAVLKMAASSITIGSGGSAGKEGAIAQIGAAFGSLLGDVLKLGGRERKLLVVSGLSAGIAGTFKTPLGGALFGLEVIIGELTLVNAIAIILASAIGTAIVEAYFGPNPPLYAPPTLTFSNPIELVFYFILGIVFGFISILWVKLFYYFEDLYDKSRILPYFKLAVGGLATGLTGFLFIDFGIFGAGYEGINLALLGKLGIVMLIILGTLKMIATANTIGSGGSGGVFAPSLFIGAMYGGAMGLVFHELFPEVIKEPFTYSLVGMGALFAAAAHAPLTMIIMIPEMTQDYTLLLPMMISCSTSYIISKTILGDRNIYTLKLLRRGVRLFLSRDLSVFEWLKVNEFMTKEVIIVKPEHNLNEVYDLIRRTHHDCYPVVKNGELVGVISTDEIMNVPLHMLQKVKVKDVMRKKYFFVYEGDSLLKAIELMRNNDTGKLLVVTRSNPRKVIGMITKTDIIRAYHYISSL